MQRSDGRGPGREQAVWPWAAPGAAALVALAAWGIAVYPSLPARIPKHIGTGGVDAWAGKSVGAAFALVFVQLGVTAVFTAVAAMMLRVTPADELREDPGPFAGLVASTTNRPPNRAAARRAARNLLILEACIGVSMLFGSGIIWRGTEQADVPGWFPVAILLPILAGTVLVVAGVLVDRRRAAAER